MTQTENNIPKSKNVPSQGISKASVKWGEFKQRQIDVTKPLTVSYPNIPLYPAEVVNMLDLQNGELVGMSCSNILQYDPKNNTAELYSLTWDDSYQTDLNIPENSRFSMLFSLAKNISNFSSLTSEQFMACNINDGRSIIIYRPKIADSSEDTDLSFISLLNSNFSIFSTIRLEIDDRWARCHQPVQFTKNNELYLQCDSGEGGGVGYYMYKVDFNHSKAILLNTCWGALDYVEPIPVTCEK